MKPLINTDYENLQCNRMNENVYDKQYENKATDGYSNMTLKT